MHLGEIPLIGLLQSSLDFRGLDLCRLSLVGFDALIEFDALIGFDESRIRGEMLPRRGL